MGSPRLPSIRSVVGLNSRVGGVVGVVEAMLAVVSKWWEEVSRVRRAKDASLSRPDSGMSRHQMIRHRRGVGWRYVIRDPHRTMILNMIQFRGSGDQTTINTSTSDMIVLNNLRHDIPDNLHRICRFTPRHNRRLVLELTRPGLCFLRCECCRLRVLRMILCCGICVGLRGTRQVDRFCEAVYVDMGILCHGTTVDSARCSNIQSVASLL